MTQVFKAKLRKIGNSLGIIIPSEIIEERGFHEGVTVNVAIPPPDERRNKVLMELAGIDKKKPPFVRDKRDRY